MDIVLGVALAPKTVRMVLVEGVKGDGAIVDHDTFDVPSTDGSAISSAADQVVAAVIGTRESATEGGHQLAAIGVTWSNRAEAAELRDALTAKGVRDVVLVSELHAAGALAQAAGRAIGYESTALLFVDGESATLAVVRCDDGSIVKVVSRDLQGVVAMTVLAELVAAAEAQDSPPHGVFVVGSGVDVSAAKDHLQGLVSLPVNAPEESALALARGAALAAANAPAFDATTAGLAYSQDPDGRTSGHDFVGLANASTMLRPVGGDGPSASDYDPAAYTEYTAQPHAEEGRKPFLLLGSALTSIFVVGVIALVISLAVSIRPTVASRPDAGEAIIPQAAPPAAAPLPQAQVPAPAPEPLPAPPPETIKAPIPVVAQQPQAPPRTVYVEQPQAPAPVVEAPPAPLPEAPPPPAPVFLPPPVIIAPPIWQPPAPRWQPWPQGRGHDDRPRGGDRHDDFPRPGFGGGHDGGGRGGGGHGCILIFCR